MSLGAAGGLIAALLLTCVGYFISLKKTTVGFSFKRDFPDEVNCKSVFPSVMSFLVAAVSVFAEVMCLTSFNDVAVMSQTLFRVILYSSVLTIVSMIVFLLISNIIGVRKSLRIHGVLLFLSLVLSGISSVVGGYFFVRASNFENIGVTIIGFLKMLFLLLALIAVVNPALKNWYLLSQKDGTDGEVVYLKPESNPLAYTEWILWAIILANVLLDICATADYFVF